MAPNAMIADRIWTGITKQQFDADAIQQVGTYNAAVRHLQRAFLKEATDAVCENPRQ
jgi:hypothetical protein